MKRIVAKEFLLLVGCLVVLVLVALFGWIRNSWFEHRAESIGWEQVKQSRVLDSLDQLTVPRHLDFLDLFEPDFLRTNYDVFLIAPFWTMDPWLNKASTQGRKRTLKEIAAGLLGDRGGDEAVFPIPPSRMNRRYLICIAKALENQKYLTSGRLVELSGRCEGLAGDVAESDAQLASGRTLHSSKPSANRNAAALKKAKSQGNFTDEWKLTAAYNEAIANDVYISAYAGESRTTWKDALIRRGVPKDEMTVPYLQDSATSAGSIPLLLAVRGFLCDTADFAELRDAFNYLKERRILRCTVDDFLCTLQNKAVPPSQVALNAVTQQRAVVVELQKELNDARASLWSAAKQWWVVKWVAIVLFVLVWPLRLLVLGTRWALKTVRA